YLRGSGRNPSVTDSKSRYSPDIKDTMECRRHVMPPLAADRRGQAPKPPSGASQMPGLRSTISSGTMRPAVLLDKPNTVRRVTGQLSQLTSVATPGSRFSPRSEKIRRNIWSEAQALQCPQRAHTEYVRPNGLPRSVPAPSPRWGNSHPRRRNRANVSLQDEVRRPPAALTSGTVRP